MKLASGTRIGQSGRELVVSVVFSLFIHVITITGVVFISMQVVPRIIAPPTYHVKLVDLPADLSQAKPAEPQRAPLPPPVKEEKTKKAQDKAKKTAKPKPDRDMKKAAMPELKDKKKKPEEQAKSAVPPAPGPKPDDKKKEAVAVGVQPGEKEMPLLPYIAIVRDKVERNWNPPPGAKGTRAKVMFQVLRSGRVGDARLDDPSGNFYFDQAAMRAILASSPFPPLPEDFSSESVMLWVDLMERE